MQRAGTRSLCPGDDRGTLSHLRGGRAALSQPSSVPAQLCRTRRDPTGRGAQAMLRLRGTISIVSPAKDSAGQEGAEAAAAEGLAGDAGLVCGGRGSPFPTCPRALERPCPGTAAGAAEPLRSPPGQKGTLGGGSRSQPRGRARAAASPALGRAEPELLLERRERHFPGAAGELDPNPAGTRELSPRGGALLGTDYRAGIKSISALINSRMFLSRMRSVAGRVKDGFALSQGDTGGQQEVPHREGPDARAGSGSRSPAQLGACPRSAGAADRAQSGSGQELLDPGLLGPTPCPGHSLTRAQSRGFLATEPG